MNPSLLGHWRILLPLCWCPVTGIMVRVFANDPRDQGSIPGRVIPKAQKWYLIPLWLILSIIRHGSRVSGAIQWKEVYPSLAIDKRAFGRPTTLCTCMYMFVCVCVCGVFEMCVFMQPLWHIQNVTQRQFLTRIKLVCIVLLCWLAV